MVGTGFNISAMIGLAAMNRAGQEFASSMERLATGKKINRASDDPAGSIAADAMTVELNTISKKIDGNMFEEKRLGALDGAQSVLSDLLLELQGLVGASANKVSLSRKDLEANQDQADSILETIDHIAATTTFDGDKIIEYLDAKGLGVAEFGRGKKLNLIDGDPEQAQHAIDEAVNGLATQRAGAGIRAKDLESELRMLQDKFANLSAARSQIVDTDYAAEVSKMVRARVLKDAAQFMLGLALKQNSQMVETLLKGAA